MDKIDLQKLREIVGNPKPGSKATVDAVGLKTLLDVIEIYSQALVSVRKRHTHANGSDSICGKLEGHSKTCWIGEVDAAQTSVANLLGDAPLLKK